MDDLTVQRYRTLKQTLLPRLKVPELKTVLQHLSLPKTGLKAELVDRIERLLDDVVLGVGGVNAGVGVGPGRRREVVEGVWKAVRGVMGEAGIVSQPQVPKMVSPRIKINIGRPPPAGTTMGELIASGRGPVKNAGASGAGGGNGTAGGGNGNLGAGPGGLGGIGHWKLSPFYEIVAPLCQARVCDCRNTSTTHSLTFDISHRAFPKLIVDPSTQSGQAGDEHRVMVFIAPENSGGAGGTGVEWPVPCELWVMGSRVEVKRFTGLKGKPWTGQPADITPLCNLSQGPGRRKLELRVGVLPKTQKVPPMLDQAGVIPQQQQRDHPTRYILTVLLVKRVPVGRVVEGVKERRMSRDGMRPAHAQHPHGQQNTDAEDDDIITLTTTHRISLHDPTSMLRITTAARSTLCEHAQCFDLETFLGLMESLPTWCCVVCSKYLGSAETLHVDEHFQSILDNTSQDVESVDVRLDGSWVVAGAGDHPSPDDQHQHHSTTPSGRGESRSVSAVVSLDSDDEATPATGVGRKRTADEDERTPPRPAKRAKPSTPSRIEVVDLTLSDDEGDVNSNRASGSRPGQAAKPELMKGVMHPHQQQQLANAAARYGHPVHPRRASLSSQQQQQQHPHHILKFRPPPLSTIAAAGRTLPPPQGYGMPQQQQRHTPQQLYVHPHQHLQGLHATAYLPPQATQAMQVRAIAVPRRGSSPGLTGAVHPRGERQRIQQQQLQQLQYQQQRPTAPTAGYPLPGGESLAAALVPHHPQQRQHIPPQQQQQQQYPRMPTQYHPQQSQPQQQTQTQDGNQRPLRIQIMHRPQPGGGQQPSSGSASGGAGHITSTSNTHSNSSNPPSSRRSSQLHTSSASALSSAGSSVYSPYATAAQGRRSSGAVGGLPPAQSRSSATTTQPNSNSRPPAATPGMSNNRRRSSAGSNNSSVNTNTAQEQRTTPPQGLSTESLQTLHAMMRVSGVVSDEPEEKMGVVERRARERERLLRDEEGHANASRDTRPTSDVHESDGRPTSLSMSRSPPVAALPPASMPVATTASPQFAKPPYIPYRPTVITAAMPPPVRPTSVTVSSLLAPSPSPPPPVLTSPTSSSFAYLFAKPGAEERRDGNGGDTPGNGNRMRTEQQQRYTDRSTASFGRVDEGGGHRNANGSHPTQQRYRDPTTASFPTAAGANTNPAPNHEHHRYRPASIPPSRADPTQPGYRDPPTAPLPIRLTSLSADNTNPISPLSLTSPAVRRRVTPTEQAGVAVVATSAENSRVDDADEREEGEENAKRRWVLLEEESGEGDV